MVKSNESESVLFMLKRFIETLKFYNVPESEYSDYLSLLEDYNRDSYGLFWKDIDAGENNKYEVLELKEKAILGSGLTHKLFEGDNYKSLLYLLKDYKNSIDLIYIDPPYNTGNSSLKYKDLYGSADLSLKHSTWLSIMSKRLKLAYDLLSDDGVIFISIDDNEYANLKLLCDSIFGETNFVANIIWQNKYTVSNDKKNGMTIQTEYILCFAKNIKLLSFNPEALREEYVAKSYKNPDNDERGAWRLVQLYKKKNPKSFTVVSPTGKEWTMPWNYTPESFAELEKDGKVYWGKDGNAMPQKKVFLKDNVGMSNRNLWLGDEVGFTGDGGNIIEDIFGDRNVFSYPKPVNLIKKIVKIASKKDSIILDFFAGSGTTGQAVIELNHEDGGSRKFILCTNNEVSSKDKKAFEKLYGKDKLENSKEWFDYVEKKGICSSVTYPRLKTVISGLRVDGSKYSDGCVDTLLYFKIKE